MGILIVLAALLAACSGPRDAFECSANTSCRNGGATGTCETTGFCSFPDATCSTGSRYGGAAGGGLANQCVGAGGSGDGGSGSGDGGPGSDAFTIVDPHPLGTWTTSVAIPVPRYTFASAQDGNYFYVMGGIQGSTGHSDVYFATGNPGAILPGAAVSLWTATTSLPANRWTNGAAYDAGYVYVFGGRTSAMGDTADVLSAPVNTDHTLGAWAATTAMPQSIKCQAIASSGPNVYIIGGKHSGTSQSLVLRATMSGGTVSGWAVAATLDITVFDGAAAVVNGYLYVLAGCGSGNFMCSQLLDIVEYAKINTDGSLGPFAHTTSLPSTWSHHTAAVSGNGDIYVLGGCHDQPRTGPDTPDVIAAHPNPDGTISAWHAVTALPKPHGRASAAVFGNYLVLFQGDTQVAPIQ